MKNLNNKKTRNEIGNLIFDIASNLKWANKVYLNSDNDDFESENYYFSEYNYYLFNKNIIKLSEDFGIDYYQVDRVMEKVLIEKEKILKRAEESRNNWQNAKYKKDETQN